MLCEPCQTDAATRLIVGFSFILVLLNDSGRAAAQSTPRERQRELLVCLEANGDGLLQPDEVPERAKPLMRRIAQRAGLNPDEPVPLDRLTGERPQEGDREDRPQRARDRNGAEGDEADAEERGERRAGRDRRDRDDDDRRWQWWNAGEDDRPRQRPDALTMEVPGFGIELGLAKVPGFDVPHSVTSQTGPTLAELEQSVDGRLIRFARRILERADENGNQIIDPSEWEGLRWRGDANDLDLNRDGRLTLVELIQGVARLREQSRDGRDGDRRGQGSPNGSADADAREPSHQATASEKQEATPTVTDSQRRYANMVIRRHDTNANGVIDGSERDHLRGDPAHADANGDGVITEDELLARLASRSANEDAGANRDQRDQRERGRIRRGATSSRRERSRSDDRGPSWFRSRDANGDGQVSMHEYSSTWDDHKAAEFAARDADGDGVISLREAAR